MKTFNNKEETKRKTHNNIFEKISTEQAQNALNIIREHEGVDPIYLSSNLAKAFETLEIYLRQKENQGATL